MKSCGGCATVPDRLNAAVTGFPVPASVYLMAIFPRAGGSVGDAPVGGAKLTIMVQLFVPKEVSENGWQLFEGIE